jgi:hypothetical protein
VSFRWHTRVLTLMLIVIAAAVALASPLPVLAQGAPDPAGDSGAGGNACFLGVICENPATWLQQTVTSILADSLSGLANDFGEAIVGFINQVNFLTRTPENLSYNNDLVKQFQATIQLLANGLLAVAVLVSGYNVMLRPYIGADAVKLDAVDATCPRAKAGAQKIE